jgi:hypothetical protein
VLEVGPIDRGGGREVQAVAPRRSWNLLLPARTASLFALRTRAASFGAGVVLFLFGFYAASTGAATPIDQLMTAAAHTIAHPHG